MDHLPRIDGQASLDVFEVEYLGGPDCHGWTERDLRHSLMAEKSSSDIKSILQSWLYFGLLSQVLEIPNAGSEFVTERSGRWLITTEQLPKYVQHWRERVRALAEGERRRRLSQARARLKASNLVLWEYYSWLPENICFSIAILGSTIDFAIYTTSAIFGILGSDEFQWPQCSLIKSRMLKANWCNSEVSRLEGQSMLSAMLFGSNLQRKEPQLGRSHKNCSNQVCIANNYAGKEYRTPHINKSCNCKPLGPDIKKLEELLDQGGFPVLQVKGTSEHGSPDIRVLDGNAKTGDTKIKYVAISHVWSDGLGNIKQNQLLRCRLLQLQEFVNELWELFPDYLQRPPSQNLVRSHENLLQTDIAFWIDTICVPKEQPFRNVAINQMRVVYQNAEKVLVLDSELQQLSRQASLEELHLKISFSGWSRRTWTLQEGALAQQLYFRTSDGFYPYSNVLSLAQESLSQASPLLWECCIVLSELVLSQRTTGTTKFKWAWNHLRMRTTTHPEDSPVVLACLLGLDIKLLLEASESTRMTALISQMSHLPQGILFVVGPRINKEYYRWAPNLPPISPIDDDTPAERKQNSLIVTLPGLEFSQALSRQATTVFFEDNDHKCYIVSFNTYQDGIRPCDKNWSYDERSLSLILQKPWHQMTSSKRPAALVCINERTASLIFAKFLCHVEVGCLSQDDVDQVSYRDSDYREMFRKRLAATKSDLSQQWAID